MQLGADLPGLDKHLVDGVRRDIDHSADGTHRHAFAEHGEDLDALGEGQLVHAHLYMNFLT
jgi:hypothetical protein